MPARDVPTGQKAPGKTKKYTTGGNPKDTRL